MHSADALRRKIDSVSHTTNTLLTKAVSKTHTTNALKRTSPTVIHATDALKRKQGSATHTTNANKRKGSTIYHTTDVLKRKSSVLLHTADALKHFAFTASHSTDAIKKRTSILIFHADAYKRALAIPQHHTSDAFKLDALSRFHNTDAYISIGSGGGGGTGTGIRAFTTDAYLTSLGLNSLIHTTNASLWSMKQPIRHKNPPILMEVSDGLYTTIGHQRIPIWNTAGRPRKIKAGTFGFNFETNNLEFWNGFGWLIMPMTAEIEPGGR